MISSASTSTPLSAGSATSLQCYPSKCCFFCTISFCSFVSPFDMAQGRSFGHSDLATAAAPILGMQS